jgi:hypothetical protein
MFRVSLALAVTSAILAGCGGGSDTGAPVTAGPVVTNPVAGPAPAAPNPVPPPVAATPTPATEAPPLVGANVRITKGLPVTAAVCDRSAQTIEVSGQITAIWFKCATQGLPLERVEVGTATKQIGVEYGNLEVGVVRFGTLVSNDNNASVDIDSVNRVIRFRHTALPLKSSIAGIGGALPTQVQAIEIDGELKY